MKRQITLRVCFVQVSFLLFFGVISLANAAATGGDLKLAIGSSNVVSSVSPGTTVDYRAQIRNVGDKNSTEGRRIAFTVTGGTTGITVQQPVPLEPSGITCTNLSIVNGQTQFSCNVASLVPDQQRNVNFKVVIATNASVTSFCAEGNIIADPIDLDASNNRAKDCKSIVAPPPPPVTLTVALSGSGSVVATIPISGKVLLTCNSGNCSASMPGGTTVKLTATPQTGFSFRGWSNGTESASACNGTNLPCTVKVTKNSSLTATFAKTIP